MKAWQGDVPNAAPLPDGRRMTLRPGLAWRRKLTPEGVGLLQDWMRIREAAAVLGTTTNAVVMLIRKGALKVQRVPAARLGLKQPSWVGNVTLVSRASVARCRAIRAASC